MKSKLTIPIFTLTIISFCIIVFPYIFPLENIFSNLPSALGSTLLEGSFTIFIIVLLGSLAMPILSIIAIYKTYKNKLDGKILTIVSLIISLINLVITLAMLTSLKNSSGFFF